METNLEVENVHCVGTRDEHETDHVYGNKNFSSGRDPPHD